MSCSSLASAAIPNVQILSTTYHAASGDLPDYCNLVGVINKRISTQDPDHFTYGIVFELNLAQSFPTGGSRPLCAYPRHARYVGSGATNDATSFECVGPTSRE